MSPAIPPAQEIDVAAGPAVGAALGPEAGPATASPGPGPTPGPSLALRGPKRPRPSPHLVPGPGHDPGLVPDLALGLEAGPRPRKEDPDQDLKVRPSLHQRMETKPKSDPRDDM